MRYSKMGRGILLEVNVPGATVNGIFYHNCRSNHSNVCETSLGTHACLEQCTSAPACNSVLLSH